MAASPSRIIPSSEPSRLIASQLGILAVCLLVLYVVAVLAAILPPALLDPAWQLRFTNALINNGFIALLGLALLHLAAYLHPTNPHLGRRRNDFATWALIPVLGFLLLIPLQGYAVWRGISTANNQQNSQLKGVTGRISALREAINKSSSTQELQQRLVALKVPPLSSPDLARPLPQLRKAMLDSLERTEIRATDKFKGIQPQQLWLVIQGSIRAVLTTLVLAVGFAAFTRRPGKELTLLQQWQERWQNPFNRRRGSSSHSPSRRPNRSQQDNPEIYLRSLNEEKEE
jgi:hypothetical protein